MSLCSLVPLSFSSLFFIKVFCVGRAEDLFGLLVELCVRLHFYLKFLALVGPYGVHRWLLAETQYGCPALLLHEHLALHCLAVHDVR